MQSSLSLRAGPDALRLIRQRGLRAADVDVMPGASGGPKWLALAGLDRFLFGEFFAEPRDRPLHWLGSSIGSWRAACFAQRDPVAALARGHHAYIHEQRYSRRPSTREVTSVLARVLDILLGPSGVDEILTHPWARVHIITAEGRGLAASDNKLALALALGLSALGNIASRKAMALQFRRCVFNSAGDDTPFRDLADLPTDHHTLTRDNLRAALLASGSIPMLMEGVTIPGAPGLHWDGGVIDYHPDVDFGAGAGLVLYPHFYEYVAPGWFDKSPRGRRSTWTNFRRALLIAPSAEFVASLPGGKIPDRRDFYTMPDAERIARWTSVVAATERLGDELRDAIARGTVPELVTPL